MHAIRGQKNQNDEIRDKDSEVKSVDDVLALESFVSLLTDKPDNAALAAEGEDERRECGQ